MSSRNSSAASAPKLSLRQAIALGALHGPAELLPISSSGHVAAVPWLLGWDYEALDEKLRKSFEVALHAGTAAALLITLRDDVREALLGLGRRRLTLIGLSLAPPAVVGYAFERPIERHLGTPSTIATALIAGAAVMAVADRTPQIRRHDQARARDALWLGVAQAAALIPGVSRTGATLAAARLLGFSRQDASRLSREAALPVIASATALEAIRLRERGVEPRMRAAIAAGASASFASTVACSWLLRRIDGNRSMGPYAAYRILLAGLMGRRLASRAKRQRSRAKRQRSRAK
jgi:undecaprenyl-diphosphatase